jgi:3-oxoacyl-[acyl-carrier-protein] synthase II
MLATQERTGGRRRHLGGTLRRVAITGIGLVTPVGCGRDEVWSALIAGRSGIGPVSSFDTSAFAVHIGAEVRDFAAEACPRGPSLGHLGRASQFAVAAARMALKDGGIELSESERERAGVCMGTTSGEPGVVERYNDARKIGALAKMPARLFSQYPCHSLAGNIASDIGLDGSALTFPTACAAGNYAIAYAADLIRAHHADVMLAGGADAFSRITYMGFARLGAIAPQRCQPFDRNRKGMVPGEGAAVLVLEEADHAKARGATIYAEVRGCGITCDAYHMTAGHPEGDGAFRAMRAALEQSAIGPDDVDYVSAHGTGTPTNDRIEVLAFRRVFGTRAHRIPMSSIKSMLGHTMGAASAMEAAACALAIHTGVIPPTVNYEAPDPDCDIDCVPNRARSIGPRVVLNNAYAFGGNNASLCLARYD